MKWDTAKREEVRVALARVETKLDLASKRRLTKGELLGAVASIQQVLVITNNLDVVGKPGLINWLKRRVSW